MSFSKLDLSMMVPKGTLTVIKNILQKQYFGDRCNDDDDEYICSAPPVRNITHIIFCKDNETSSCFELPIEGIILNEEKKDKKYSLMVDTNKELGAGEEKTLVFFPPVAEHIEIITKNGIVLAVKPLSSTTLNNTEASINKTSNPNK